MSSYYLENNSYCTKIYIGTDSIGRKKYKKLKAKTKNELDKRVLQLKQQLEEGLDVFRATDTLEQWIERYIDYLEGEVNSGNYQEYEWKTIKARLRFFLDYSGGRLSRARICDILPVHIQPAINSLFQRNPATNKPSSKRTIERYLRSLGNVFEYARKQRAYNFCNPCDDVKVPKNAKKNKRVPLNNRTIQLVLTTEHRARVAACILMLTGIRRGELTALTWADVDLKNKVIYINKSYCFKSLTIKPPKTEAGIREIPISDYLVEILKEEKKKSRSEYVIEKASGGIMTEQAWKVMFESYMLALEAEDQKAMNAEAIIDTKNRFKKFTIHQLRHTYCSLLQWSGVDMKTAQELMGHSEMRVTADTYTQGNEELKIQAAYMQGEYLKSKFVS